MENLIAEILSRYSHGPGASTEQIADAEKRLGIRLPPDYRQFVARIGWAWVGIYTVNGLGGDDSVVESCEFERNADDAFPRTWLPFSPDGFGNHCCVDAVSGGVYDWDHEVRRTDHRLADSFEAWLRMAIEEPDGSGDGACRTSTPG